MLRPERDRQTRLNARPRGSGTKNENKERKFGKGCVDQDLIDGVILLPDNPFYNWLERETRLARREKSRAQFLAAVEAGRASWDVVKLPPLPYQTAGAAHLAFHECARPY